MKTHRPAPEEQQLVRLLSGQLPAEEAEKLRLRIAADPALETRFARLLGSWQRLELPPTTPPPAGYAQRLTVRATTEIALSPLLARSRGYYPRLAASLLAGLALGAGLGMWRHHGVADAFREDGLAMAAVAESYWRVVVGETEGEVKP